MTIFQRSGGCFAACLVASITALAPAGLQAEPLMVLSESFLTEPGTVHRARAHYPLRLTDLFDPGIRSDRAALAAMPVPPHDDLFRRLRAGFSLEPVAHRRVDAELDWLIRHPDYVERVFGRAQRFMPYIVAEIERGGLPLELALLPVVESGYDPFAYSHGRAAGLWQFIPGTGRRYGIRQNWWYDGRRDVVDATDAALTYLARLQELMGGDWLLAVASYNMGEGNVQKAVERNRANGQPTDFWSLKLTRETSSYVPRLLAVVELVRNPEDYGITLPTLIDAPQFAAVDTGGQLDLALAAELAGLDLDLLHELNAGFNRWATDPSGPHRLLLPVEVAATFEQALATVSAEDRLRWKRHKIESGETLSQIADRYRTTVESIREANGIRGNTIRAGSALMIPVSTRPLADYSRSADQRRAATQNKTRPGRRVEHTVAAGESFWSISRRYGVTMQSLAAWNGMAPRDVLSIGQKLVVWTSDGAPAAMHSATTRKLNYTVRRGDSLYLIASRFRVTIDDLVRWNGIDVSKYLKPGQKLTLFVDVTRQSS